MYNFFQAYDSETATRDTVAAVQKIIPNKPWCVKYRPRNLDDFANVIEHIGTFQKMVETRSVPHLLFHGPFGTGKTTVIKALCQDLYGDKTSQYVLELNASDERGINIVRDRIKKFSKTSVRKTDMTPFKMIILDEADNMTDDAQTALRRVIEKHSDNTRFCLICNHISQINDAIKSRCSLFWFKPLTSPEVVNVIKRICSNENIKIQSVENEEARDPIEQLVTINKGNLKRCITHLQAISIRSADEMVVTLESVQDTSNTLNVSTLTELIKSRDDPRKQMNVLQRLIKNGFIGKQILNQLFEQILSRDDLDDLSKFKIFKKMSEIEWRLNCGCDEFLQLLDLFQVIM